MNHSLSRDLLQGTPRVMLLAVLAASLSCASVSSPSTSQCPQPRVTGQAPAAVFNTTSPLAPNARDVAAGRKLYEGAADTGCHLCHGIEGDGQGPLATQFEPPPRNFACAKTVIGIPDGQLYWIIKNGSPGTAMPSFNHLRDQQIWQLVMYLRQLSQ
ncbi:MAG: c-type cytochrome [Gammaproteobacteria bacterium]|nr:c-type cytochrome [Gammaproteobacteria bacterium]